MYIKLILILFSVVGMSFWLGFQVGRSRRKPMAAVRAILGLKPSLKVIRGGKNDGKKK